MPELPAEVQHAIATKAPPPPTYRDLQEMVQTEKEKAAIEKAAEPEKPAKKSTAKEDAARATELLAQRLGYDRPLPEQKKEEKKDEAKDEKPEKEPAKADKDKLGTDLAEGKDKPAEEPPKKGKVSKRKEIDPVEIATHAATRAAQEVLQASGERTALESRPVEKAATTGDEHLSDEERAELIIFREMAESNPAHKSLPNQYLAYLKRAESYQRDWEKANPGEEFNPDDDAHDKFFKSAEPKYSPREFAKAEARIEARAIIEKERATTSREHSELKSQLAIRELEPQIRNTQVGATAEIIKTINEHWLNIIEKDGFQKFAESNPIEADLIHSVAANIGPFIAAALAIDDPKGRIPYNPSEPGHQEWGNYLTEKENELRSKPMKDRMTEDNRVIVSRLEFARLPQERRNAYAYLDAATLIKMRVAEEAEKVQQAYEKEQKRLESYAKARGWTKQTVANQPQTPANGESTKEEKPEQKKEEVKSPEASSSARVDTSGNTPTSKPDNLLESTAKILFRR